MTRRQTTPTDAPPDTLTVEEAARIVRIGRSTAYKLVKEYEETGGASGLPMKWVGCQRRVPRLLLEEFLGGPITWPIPDAPAVDTPANNAPADVTAEPDPTQLPAPIPLATRRRAERADDDQLALDVEA